MGGGIETIVIEIGKLAGQGHVAFFLACLAMLALFLARWLGLQLGSTRIYYWVFAIGAPIFVFFVFLAAMSGGSLEGAFLVAGAVLGLVLILQLVYIIVFVMFRKSRTP